MAIIALGNGNGNGGNLEFWGISTIIGDVERETGVEMETVKW